MSPGRRPLAPVGEFFRVADAARAALAAGEPVPAPRCPRCGRGPAVVTAPATPARGVLLGRMQRDLLGLCLEAPRWWAPGRLAIALVDLGWHR